MNNLKFCKDCKYYDPTLDPIKVKIYQMSGNEPPAVNPYAKCMHIESAIEDDGSYARFLVTGEGECNPSEYKNCSTMRRYACGENAKLFEPKE